MCFPNEQQSTLGAQGLQLHLASLMSLHRGWDLHYKRVGHPEDVGRKGPLTWSGPQQLASVKVIAPLRLGQDNHCDSFLFRLAIISLPLGLLH